MVHSRSFWQAGLHPNPATYPPIDGIIPNGAASPAMGGHLFIASSEVLLSSFVPTNKVCSLPDLTITLPSGSLVSSQSASSHVLVIVGATVGVLGGFLFLATIAFILRRRKGPEATSTNGPPETLDQRHRGKILPFTGPLTDGSQMQQNRIPPARPEKFISSPDRLLPVALRAVVILAGMAETASLGTMKIKTRGGG